MKRLGIALLLMTALLTGESAAQAPALLTLRIAAQPGDEVTPVLYAQQAGLFAKAGLDVKIEQLGSGSAITAAVAGGSIDIGKSSLMPLITAHEHGAPFALIAPGLPWNTNAPTAGLAVASASTIESGRDLNGKTLSTSALKDLGEIGIRSWIDQHGGDSKTVHFVEIPARAVVAALDTGRIAAGNLVDPILSDGVASGKVKIIGRPDDAIGKRFLTTAWFAEKGYIERNRATIESFERVMQTATAYTNDHQAEMIPIMAPFWNIAPDVLGRMAHGKDALTLAAVDIQPLIDAAAKYGAIAKPFPAAEMISPLALAPRR